MIRLLLIFVLLTQMGCSIFLQTAAGTLVGNVGSNIMMDDEEAPNVPADGTVGIDSDENIYILKP
jgi:hypothetical protein